MKRAPERGITAIIMAAGKGTRMKTVTPKVLHRLAGRPLIDHVLETAAEAGAGRILVVVGHGSDRVAGQVRSHSPGAEAVLQEPQLGTGHAVMQCLDHLEGSEDIVLVLSGDVPLLKAATLERLVAALGDSGPDLAVLTGIIEDPTGYGRIIRDSDGAPAAVVEHRDLVAEQDAIREVNLGIYAIRAPFLVQEVRRLSDDNAQGEYYLTDLVQAAAAGAGARALCLEDPNEALGVNTLMELNIMEEKARREKIEKLMAGGVRIIDPGSTWIDDTVTVGADSTIYPMVSLRGNTRVGEGVTIDQGCVIADSEVGDRATLYPYCVINLAIIRQGAEVGPFARLRPEADIGPGAKVGNFVEIKKSVLGEGSKVSHLTYVGDSQLGKKVNIGAGSVTCNYDGFAKYRTVIEDGAFVGSGTMMVAPITIGAGAIIAAGSTLTGDVPPDSLALARSRQVNKEDYARSWREKAQAKKEGGKD